ncbi:MAG: HoxN/HupN/NixA family nickel/cobalt transporter [Candidatus Dormibacteraeota bacterium]|nr:HoxN/HupN/NixA family nickel/cobalt transporter [Candidatus Dormibacteraeota bacterium]
MAAVPVSRVTKMRRSLTGSEWLRLSGFYSFVALLHLIGWGVLILLVVPSHFKALGIGAGLTAYGFGLRHAFDADHISAIDNTTRKLLADGKKPLGVGFFFSLGHSTIVFGLSVALVFAAKAVSGQVGDGSVTLTVGGYIGTGVSAFFLYLIAAINLVILVGIIRIFREMRQGKYDEATLEDKLNQRGLMNRVLGPLARKIRSSWQMYPVGVLFGLGFDTATEVGLLALAAGTAAVGGIPWYGTLCLPVLFAAGMCLMDTTDGAFMNVAYGWAFSKPIRKVFYNLTITGLSVAVALLVGTVEILSIAITYFKLSGGVWDFLSSINLNVIGFIIVGTFVVTWLGALAIWRFARIEQRWALAPATAEGTAELRANAAARERLENHTKK